MKDPRESIGYYILGSRDEFDLKTELREQDPPFDQFGHTQIWKLHNVLVVRSDNKKFAKWVGSKSLDTKIEGKQFLLYDPHLVACLDSVWEMKTHGIYKRIWSFH